jgi:hypothetical protein
VQSIGSVDSLGLSKSFKQIMLSDPCFVMEQRHVSEAWFSLNYPLLNPISAINALWPADAADADVRVKRAAATALYLSPYITSSMTAVAAAVAQELSSAYIPNVGATITDSIRQVLQGVAGVFVFSADGQQLALDIGRLLRQRQRQQQQQQQQQPVPRSAAASTGTGSVSLAAAITTLWPADAAAAAEVRMWHAAAMFLSNQAGGKAKITAVAAAVDLKVGSASKLGLGKSFKEVMSAQADIFQRNNKQLTLNTQQLLQAHQLLRQQQPQQQQQQILVQRAAVSQLLSLPEPQQQQQQQQYPVAGVAASTAIDSSPLAAAIHRRWPEDAADPKVRMRHAAAIFLSRQPGYNSGFTVVTTAIDKMAGSVKKLGITTSCKQVLLEDAGLLVFSADGLFLKLDAEQLMQQQQQQPAAHEAAGAAGDGSLTAAIASLWPASVADPEVRIQRAAALHLSSLPGYTSTTNKLAQVVNKTVGNTSKLGIQKSFRQVLEGQAAAFNFTPSRDRSDGGQVTLGAVHLHKRHQQQQQLQAGSHQQTAAVLVVPRKGAPPAQQQQQQQRVSSASQPEPPPPSPLVQPPAPPARQQPPPPPAAPQQQQQQQQPAPSAPKQANQQQQQSAWQQQPGQPLAVMPLPEGLCSLQALNSLTAVECATAGITIVAEQQPEGQLQQVLMHLKVAKLCALDLEFAQPDAPAVTNSSSSSRGDKAGGRAASRGAHLDRLALLQLFVPSTAAAAATSASSTWQQQQQQWPAAVYLFQVPEEQQAAAALLTQLQPVLEDAAVSKVMHDARWDSCVLQAQFGISLAGVLDTQLLAGLTNLAAGSAGTAGASSGGSSSSSSSTVAGLTNLAAGSAGAAAAVAGSTAGASSSNSSSSGVGNWDGYLGRVGLGKLYGACGLPHPTKGSMAQAFDANPR